MTPPGSPESPHEEHSLAEAPVELHQPEIPYRVSWQNRLLSISFAIFAFEIGLFLVIFPWLGDAWSSNFFEALSPSLQGLWDGPYLRGAVSGLGLINMYIALLQVARMFRRGA
jgi:hypothetical protein